jgi:hypothetical protein
LEEEFNLFKICIPPFPVGNQKVMALTHGESTTNPDKHVENGQNRFASPQKIQYGNTLRYMKDGTQIAMFRLPGN